MRRPSTARNATSAPRAARRRSGWKARCPRRGTGRHGKRSPRQGWTLRPGGKSQDWSWDQVARVDLGEAPGPIHIGVWKTGIQGQRKSRCQNQATCQGLVQQRGPCPPIATHCHRPVGSPKPSRRTPLPNKARRLGRAVASFVARRAWEHDSSKSRRNAAGRPNRACSFRLCGNAKKNPVVKLLRRNALHHPERKTLGYATRRHR